MSTTATEKTLAYRARKRAKGICIYGGCWERAREGTALCMRHAAEESRHNTEWRRLHPRPPRLCKQPGCSTPLSAHHSYCAAHVAQRDRESRRAYVRRKRAAGLCVYGGCYALARPEKSLCATHFAEEAARKTRRWLALHPRRCQVPGCKDFGPPRSTYCRPHALLRIKAAKLKDRRARYWRKRAGGLCTHNGCWEQTMSKGLCEKHLVRQGEVL